MWGRGYHHFFRLSAWGARISASYACMLAMTLRIVESITQPFNKLWNYPISDNTFLYRRHTFVSMFNLMRIAQECSYLYISRYAKYDPSSLFERNIVFVSILRLFQKSRCPSTPLCQRADHSKRVSNQRRIA